MTCSDFGRIEQRTGPGLQAQPSYERQFTPMLHIPHSLPLHPEACFRKVLTQQGKDSPPRWLPLLAGAGSWISEFYLATTLRFEFFLSCDSGSSLITRKSDDNTLLGAYLQKQHMLKYTPSVLMAPNLIPGPECPTEHHWLYCFWCSTGMEEPSPQIIRLLSMNIARSGPGTPEHKKRKTWLIQS